MESMTILKNNVFEKSGWEQVNLMLDAEIQKQKESIYPLPPQKTIIARSDEFQILKMKN